LLSKSDFSIEYLNNCKHIDYLVLTDSQIKDKELIKLIKNQNKDIKLGIEINDINHFNIDEFKLDFIQTKQRDIATQAKLKELYDDNIELFFITNIDCDEDIYWSLPVDFNKKLSDKQIINQLKTYNVNIQLNLLANYQDDARWRMLINECGKFIDDLSLNDINNFSKSINTFIQIPLPKQKIDLKSIFPYAKGFVF